MLDAMVLLAATAVGLVRLPEAWPEAREVFRRLDLSHFQEDGFPGRNFHAKPQTGRMDSMGRTIHRILQPLLEMRTPRPGFLKSDGSRSTYAEWLENFGLSRTNRRAGGRAAGYASAAEAYVLAFPFLLAWSIGLLVLRLRRPRPELPGLWRQPGWCGCAGAVVGVALGLAEEAVVEWPAPTVIAPAMAGLSWVVLLVTRRWSAEASWIDRAGRCLAVAWIVMIPLYLVGFALLLL